MPQRRDIHRAITAAGAGLFVLAAAPAQADGIETVTVTASAMPGTALDPARVPAQIQTLSAADLSRFGSASLLDGLMRNGAGVSLDAAQGNPFQPNIVYRGFEASPLQGNAQGLAVYLGGVRFNQPFGDTVYWDLVPAEAIRSLTLEGANPVFGLNALGGSLALTMKSGFDYQGGEMELSGGSYGEADGALQYGVEDEGRALYVAVHGAGNSGWRAHSPSQLGQFYSDFGWRGERSEVHLSLTAADTDLTGNGVAPVELLAAKRSAVFTFPDITRNRYVLANLSGRTEVNAALSLQANAYASYLDQSTKNGDASDAAPCDPANGFLCLDGDLLTDRSGAAIPDFLAGGNYAQFNGTTTQTIGFGGTLQAAYGATLFGFANKLIAGASYDGGRTRFSASSAIGAMTAQRGFQGPGIVIDQTGGSIAPVKTDADNDYVGLYASDILSLTDALTLTTSARYNIADVRLHDLLGTALNGAHDYGHFNPALGATYQITDGVSAYAGWSKANRAPTPAELSCADASAPCSLTNFFVGDPDLKQVVAHTIEAGLRGNSAVLGGRLAWQAGLYRTVSEDDIQYVSSPIIGRAFFRNVGQTRRQGFDIGAQYDAGPWAASLSYSRTEATFQSPLTLNSPDDPAADANGEIHVRPGDRIPGVVPDLVKLGLDWQADQNLRISAAMRVATGQYLSGDEANQNPATGTYAVFDLGADYALSDRLTAFASLTNLFDAHYATFGTFSPTADVPLSEAPGATNARSLSPGAPRMVTGGLRLVL
jgi:outer membrane receptor protein involved in Fe transport